MERIIRAVFFRDHKIILLNYLVIFLLTAVILLLLVSCFSAQAQKNAPSGVYHVVKKGETAYSIARLYDISLPELKKNNDIKDLSNIQEGSVFFIPGASHAKEEPVAKQAAASEILPSSKDKPPSIPEEKQDQEQTQKIAKPPLPTEKKQEQEMTPPPLPAEKKQEAKAAKGIFVWPVRGEVKTHFGLQPNKTYFNWIKISCATGAKVKAAAAGTVIFSAPLKDFGETIIIRHAGDLATVYTHLQQRTVQADQTVKKNRSIGLAGQKDEAGAVFINFEIRYKGKARNPLPYLP